MLWSNVLLAYDGTTDSLKAVEYVGKMFGGLADGRVTVFMVTEPVPSTDMDDTHYTAQVKDRIHALERENETKRMQLGEVKRLLLKHGFGEDRVALKVREDHKGVAKEIMDEAKAGGHGTVVVARHQGGYLKDMFMGSVSASVVRGLTDATVCVVE